MDVLLNEEEEMVKNAAREFLEGECPPSLAREMEVDDLGYPPELWRQMAQLGWIVPGGAGVARCGLLCTWRRWSPPGTIQSCGTSTSVCALPANPKKWRLPPACASC